MIFAGFSIAKLLTSFNIFNGVNLGKLLKILIPIVLCLGIFWKVFIKQDAPIDKSSQEAGGDIITYQAPEERALLGIEFFGVKLRLIP